MIMIIFYVFLAAESEFDNHLSPTRLDLAVQEVKILAFLSKIETIFLAKVDHHCILDVFNVFLDKESKKTSE